VTMRRRYVRGNEDFEVADAVLAFAGDDDVILVHPDDWVALAVVVQEFKLTAAQRARLGSIESMRLYVDRSEMSA
jgi:hypothetical protein